MTEQTYTDPKLVIPARYLARCEKCGKPLDTRATGIFQFTSGWVQQREGGGGHGISLPQRDPTRWAHRHCIESEARGYGDQKSML